MDDLIDEKGSFLICRHGEWYRNGEQQPQTFVSDRTLSVEEMDELERIKQRYYHALIQTK